MEVTPDCHSFSLHLQLKAMSEECGSAVELQGVKTIPLKDRLQCDCCAAAISDVHRTCSNEQCGDFDMCIKCSLDARKQDKVNVVLHLFLTCLGVVPLPVTAVVCMSSSAACTYQQLRAYSFLTAAVGLRHKVMVSQLALVNACYCVILKKHFDDCSILLVFGFQLEQVG